MSQQNYRKKVPETCRFWRESKCQKGEYQCSFVHGYICPNDGRCWRENCNRIHFNQKKNMQPRDHYAKPHPNHQRGGHRSRYRRSHSRSQSPPRHRKVFQRGRSPQRHRSRSRSPTYHTRVYSPYQRRSRSPSPFRGASRSLSPLRHRFQSRSRSRSWHRSKSPSASRPGSRGHSPDRIKSRSSSPIRSRSKSHSSSKLHNKSHSSSRSLSRSPSPKQRKRSSSSSSSSSKRRPKSRTGYVHPQSSSPSSVKDKRHKPVHSKNKTPIPVVTETDGIPPNRNSSNAGQKMQLDLENIYADLECETNPVLTASKTLDKDAVEKEALSKLQAHIARDFMNPETQKLMEQVLSSTKEKTVKPNPLEESKSKKEFFLDEVGDDIELDLEEVGEEVDDIFAKSINRSMDDSNEDRFDKGLSSSRILGLQAGSNPSPPKSNPVSKSEKPADHFLDVDFHTDWELKDALETASKSLKKPPQMPPPNQLSDGSKMGGTSLWTPALVRHQTLAPKNKIGYQRKDNDWEVETPYVGRKDKSEIQRSTGPSRTATNDAPACDVSPNIPFALPLPESINIHRSTHKVTEISRENKDERMIQQTDVLFPSAQSIPSNIPSKVSHTINQVSKPSASSAGQGVLATSMLAPCTANLIRDATNEKELYHSPKEGATAPKKVSEEQTPRKSLESPKTPKRSKRKRRKEKKPKRKKDSSEDEDDSSDSEDSKGDRKSSQEKDNDEVEVLLFKRESLMKRVKLLVEQKGMMSNQREDIINSHKGSKASLSSILEENSFLIKEIGKQIGNINNMIKNINQDIEAKRDTFKQKTSVSKDKAESPRMSGEPYKISQYSAEKERIPKKMLRPTERSEVYRASPYQEYRSKSPYRKSSRSPSPLSQTKHVPSEPEQKPKDRDISAPRSPKATRHKRSRSPSSNVAREAPKPVPPPEMKQSASPPRKRPVKSMIEVNKKPAGPSASQHHALKNTNSSMQYAPHETQRTYIRYIDQGMHWCKLCSLFCETSPEYVNHLMTDSHLARVKNDRKSWLSKAPKEEKDPKPPNAQVLTVPIQGLEFLHSLPCYYCSLCDTFLRDRGEAIRHPESKMHVSKYKVHRAQNPLFESTFLKAKTTAYAKYKIDEERKKMESELSLNEKTTSLENKLLKQIKEKFDKEGKEDRVSDSRDDSNKTCGSIRVASRGPRYSTDKKPSTTQPPPSNANRHSKEKEILPKGSDGSKKKTDVVGHSKAEVQKSEIVDSENDDSMDNGDVNEKISFESKVESKQKEEGSNDGSRDTDTDRKATSSKLPLIGKMPFLKRKASMSKSKDQQSTSVEEVSKQKKEPKEEHNLSEKLKIPLPHYKVKDFDTMEILDKTLSPIQTEAGEKELPVTSVNSEEKVMKQNASNSPPVTDAINCSISDKKDIGGSALYDPLEAVDEDSSEGVAAATIEALDLLNIPLPGFKTAADVQELSDVPLPPETEDVYQPEDMEIENIPLDEEGIEGGIEEVYPSSRIIVHPDIPLPPGVEVPPTQMSLNEPPPPGTEETDHTLNCKIGVNVHQGNILPVFGPHEFIPKQTSSSSKIQRNESADIPVPPGTEGDYNTDDVSCLSLLSAQSKVDRIGSQRHHSGLVSPGSNSWDAPLSFSGKILHSTSAKPTTVLKIQQKDKTLPCHTERELTPPPPGTESLPDERHQSIMSRTNKGAVKDLKMITAKLTLTSSSPKIYTNEEKVSSSPKSNSSSTFVKTSSSSLSLLSNQNKTAHSGEASEIVKKMYIKDSSSECSKADTKYKELDSKCDHEESSSTISSKQPDTKHLATSSYGSSLSQPNKAVSPSVEGNSGLENSTSISLLDEDRLVHPKAVVSGNVDDKKDSFSQSLTVNTSQCLTVNTKDEKQDSNSSDEDRSYTLQSRQDDTGNVDISPVSTLPTNTIVCDSQGCDKGSVSKECVPDEQDDSSGSLKKTAKDNNECYGIMNETMLIHSSDDNRSYTPLLKQDDTGNIATSSVKTPPASSKVCDSQDPDKDHIFKECMSDEQDNNSSSGREIPEDSNDCSDIINEKDLTLSIDINEEPKSPIIKCGSPLQFVNFPKGFESMDIADLYSPSTSDSTCIQSIGAHKSDSYQTRNEDAFSILSENIMDAKEDLSEIQQRKAELKEEVNSESDVEKDQNEIKFIQETSCRQNIELHANESDTSEDSNEDHNSHKSNDTEGEAFPLEHPDERKAAISTRKELQKDMYKEQEAFNETEEITQDDPAVLVDEVHSKTCEEESVSKEEKRKPVRKTTRKRTTKVKKTEDGDHTPPRTSASKSNTGCLSPSFVDSPRPMRSSRKAAAAAIKAMAKDQDDTPPDSPPSDNDTDYSD